MPWWAIIYLALFLAFSLTGDVLAWRGRESRWRCLCDCVAGLIFAVLFAAFWLSAIHRALGLLAPLLFLLAIGWEIYSSSGDLREIWHDEELSKVEKVGLIIAAPLLVWPCY
ncbi:MAG: hypothetical protein KJ070_26550 [Verrucomicrobia bacterium]|nr:hypothetical protein [Verrucomicrobiota bacterium]